MLSVLCLSLVPVLRCVALKRIEFSALLVPPGVEVLFSIFFLFKRGGTGGRYHYLLCAEGIAYFLLALTDFLTHIIPVLHRDLLLFKIIDLILGGLSLVPLLFFTVWFLFAARQELIHLIPPRLRTATSCIFMSCIVFIATSDVTGAFVGISYRTVGGVNAVGFIDENARFLWTFFNMFSLAALAVFEAGAFLLLSARLMKVVLHKRRMELVGGRGEIHHFRGIIPINLGMLLSLAETLIGFVGQSFALTITRRGTRSAGRILIIVGLLRGWDRLEDVRFVLQEPLGSKRISRFSVRQFLPSIRTPSDGTQISELGNERVSVTRHRGRAPTLHLRLSEFDMGPVMRALRSSTRSHSSLHAQLIPGRTPTDSVIEAGGGEHQDALHQYRRNPPSDVPSSPATPNSPWAFTGPTPRASSANSRTRDRDGDLLQSTHMREDTVSSTMSSLREVMTLSESPPDPGFVLPIPSRSRGRLNFSPPPVGLAQSVEMAYARELQVDRGLHQFEEESSTRYATPMEESNPALPPLDPPQLRQPSWVSESSNASSAMISTAMRLTRANTSVSMTSVAIRRTPIAISDEGLLARRESMVANEYPFSSLLPATHTARPGGDTS